MVAGRVLTPDGVYVGVHTVSHRQGPLGNRAEMDDQTGHDVPSVPDLDCSLGAHDLPGVADLPAALWVERRLDQDDLGLTAFFDFVDGLVGGDRADDYR